MHNASFPVTNNNIKTRLYKGITTNQFLIPGCSDAGILVHASIQQNRLHYHADGVAFIQSWADRSDNFHAFKTPILEHIAVLTFQLINQWSQTAMTFQE